MESIEQGTDRPSPGPRRRLALAGVLIATLILAALGWALDSRWRAAATADLTRAFDETLSVIETAERRVQSVAEYARPARERADMDPAVRQSLGDLAQESAREEATDIERQRAAIDDVRLLPWHSDLHTARDHAGAWLDLRASGIVNLAQTGRATYAPREQLDAARAALREAWRALTPPD